MRAYVLLRARGMGGFISRSAAVTASYRKLVKDGHAPLWPLTMSYICVILGICVVFGAILFSKR